MKRLAPFDIVSAKYETLSGEINVGLFLVLDVSRGTVTACKITSQHAGVNDLSYFIGIGSHPFLQTDSYVQTDKFHTLFANKCEYVGEMAIYCRRGFILKFTNVFGKLRNSLERYAPAYISPNKKY